VGDNIIIQQYANNTSSQTAVSPTTIYHIRISSY